MEKQLAFSKTFSLFSQRNFIVASIDVRGSGFQGDEFKHTVFRSPSLHRCHHYRNHHHHQWHHRHHQFYIVFTIAIIIRCWRVQAPSLQISSWYNHHCGDCHDHNEMFLQAAWERWGPWYSVCDQVRSSLISWSLRHQITKASKFNFHLQNFHFPKVFLLFPKFHFPKFFL